MTISTNTLDDLTLTLESLVTLQNAVLNNDATTDVQRMALQNAISTQIGTLLTAQKKFVNQSAVGAAVVQSTDAIPGAVPAA